MERSKDLENSQAILRMAECCSEEFLGRLLAASYLDSSAFFTRISEFLKRVGMSCSFIPAPLAIFTAMAREVRLLDS